MKYGYLTFNRFGNIIRFQWLWMKGIGKLASYLPWRVFCSGGPYREVYPILAVNSFLLRRAVPGSLPHACFKRFYAKAGRTGKFATYLF